MITPAKMVDLDRRVALALGHRVEPAGGSLWASWIVDGDEWLANYCGDWREGGPVIEREKMNVWHRDDEESEKQWHACITKPSGYEVTEDGPTLLIAAMRALVEARGIPA